MVWSTLAVFILGLIVLVLGAEVMVRGASRLASAFGISSRFIIRSQVHKFNIHSIHMYEFIPNEITFKIPDLKSI